MKAPGSDFGRTVVDGVNWPPSEIYPAGVELTSQGAHAARVYLIESGGAKLIHSFPEGREIILAKRLPGGLVGASSALLSEPCRATAVTTVRSRLVNWPARAFRAEIERNHSFSKLVNEILSREADELGGRLALLGRGCARAKVLHFLNEHLTSDSASRDGAWTPLRLRMTQRELAQILAVSPFHLSKVWSALERDGLLRRSKTRTEIDPTAVACELSTVRQRRGGEPVS